MALVGRQNIFDYIPQRDPICLVHTIYQCTPELIQTGFNVEKTHLLVGNEKLSEAGITENMAQTAAAHAGFLAKQNNEPTKVGFIGNIKDLKIFSLPDIGTELITVVKVKAHIMNVTLIEASSECNGTPVASCEMKIFLQE